MKSMKKVLLGTALAVGALGITAAPAHAAKVRIFVGIGAPAAYVPPAPGPGYAWIAGYWSNGYWVPGYWNYVGFAGPAYRYDRDYYRDRDWNRERNRDYYRDRDHFRR